MSGVDRLRLPDLIAWRAEATPDALFAVGYYQEATGSPRFFTDRVPDLPSIGGCPVPRTDPWAPAYRIAYVDQVDRAIESICRATGAEETQRQQLPALFGLGIALAATIRRRQRRDLK